MHFKMTNGNIYRKKCKQACWIYAYMHGLSILTFRELVGGKTVLNQISLIFKTQAGLHHSLVDFDNHLDDISLDWLNHEVNKQIEGSKQLTLTVGDNFGSSPMKKEPVSVEDVMEDNLVEGDLVNDDNLVNDDLVNDENLPEQ